VQKNTYDHGNSYGHGNSIGHGNTYGHQQTSNGHNNHHNSVESSESSSSSSSSSSEQDTGYSHSSDGKYTAATSEHHDRYSTPTNNNGRYTEKGYDYADDSQLDEWSDEAGTDYEAKEETSSESETDKEESITEDEDEEVSDEKEVQEGNANEEEVKAEGGGGMPKMPLKMPNPAKMNDQDMDKLTEQINTLFHSIGKFTSNMKEYFIEVMEKKKKKLLAEKRNEKAQK